MTTTADRQSMAPPPQRDGARILDSTAALMARRFLVFGVGMLAAIIATGLVIDRSFTSRGDDVGYVHLASRQALIVQSIADLGTLVTQPPDANPTIRPAAERLDQQLDELVAVHADLGYDGSSDDGARTLPVHISNLLDGPDGMAVEFHEFVDRMRLVADETMPPDEVRELVELSNRSAEGRLAEQLSIAATVEQQEAEAGLAEARRLTWLLGGVTAASLLALILLVLRPVLRGTRSAAVALRQAQDVDLRRRYWHSEFAAIADHELRTPVTVLAGLARTLDEHHDSLDDELRRDIIHRMRGQGDVMAELLGELSTVAGLAGAPRSVTSFPVGELLQEVRGGRATVDVESPPVLMSGDRDRLRLLCKELVDNGHSHGVPPVSIRVMRTRDTLVMLITDDGPGIDSENLDHLLRPFAIGDTSLHHQRSDGRGLGLAMVASIVEDEGGTLEYRRLQDKGTWAIHLPGCVVGLVDVVAEPAPVTGVRA